MEAYYRVVQDGSDRIKTQSPGTDVCMCVFGLALYRQFLCDEEFGKNEEVGIPMFEELVSAPVSVPGLKASI
jgi:hypothetical protein